MNSMSAVSKLDLNLRSDITYLGPTWTKTLCVDTKDELIRSKLNEFNVGSGKLALNFRSDITYLGPTWTKTLCVDTKDELIRLKLNEFNVGSVQVGSHLPVGSNVSWSNLDQNVRTTLCQSEGSIEILINHNLKTTRLECIDRVQGNELRV